MIVIENEHIVPETEGEVEQKKKIHRTKLKKQNIRPGNKFSIKQMQIKVKAEKKRIKSWVSFVQYFVQCFHRSGKSELHMHIWAMK